MQLEHKKIVFIGYSGHSFGCIEVAKKQGYKIVGYYDIKENILNEYKLRYLGYEDSISSKDKPFIAIGDNKIRRKIYEKLKWGQH